MNARTIENTAVFTTSPIILKPISIKHIVHAKYAAEKALYNRLIKEAPKRKPPQSWYDEDQSSLVGE